MSDVPAGAASLPDENNSDEEQQGFPPDPEESSSFAAAAAPSSSSNSHNDSPGFAAVAKKPSHEEEDEEEYYLGKKKAKRDLELQQYILGTLIVRVVAARDLEPAQKRGIGKFFGGGKAAQSPARNGRGGGADGTANPYASVKFGTSTQRTTEVFDTLDPVWPRQETMFMDVSLPTHKLTHPKAEDPGLAYAARMPNDSDHDNDYERPNTVLTVAMFHTPEIGGATNKYPNKKGIELSGDSDDQFLGMASVDLTEVLTGRLHTFDQWVPLSGAGQYSRGRVRIVCEYEASDPIPRTGDLVRFTSYCHPADLFPLVASRLYQVAETNGDDVIISYESPEGWICTFQTHRYSLICEERRHTAFEAAQDELASLTERLKHSPMVQNLQESVERVAVDGLLGVGSQVVQGGFALFGRWAEGGLDTAVQDVAYATNWDGRNNPNSDLNLNSPTGENGDDHDDGESHFFGGSTSKNSGQNSPSKSIDEQLKPVEEAVALPNMPSCPITAFPMLDPVVAADGHTYERNAIARWLQGSDKSPLTGAVLPHKELVPNYGLLSSLQEAADRATKDEVEASVRRTDDSQENSNGAAKSDQDDGDDSKHPAKEKDDGREGRHSS